MSRLWQGSLVFAAAIALGLTLTACGSGNESSNAATTEGAGFSSEAVAQQIRVAADAKGALRWDKATYEATAGDITFVVANASSSQHQFTVAGNGVNYRSKNFGGSTTQNFTVKGLPPGEYQIVCDYPGHKAAGMVSTLIVR